MISLGRGPCVGASEDDGWAAAIIGPMESAAKDGRGAAVLVGGRVGR